MVGAVLLIFFLEAGFTALVDCTTQNDFGNSSNCPGNIRIAPGVCLPAGYDKRQRPNLDKDPIHVQTSFGITNVANVDPEEQTIVIVGYLTYTWVEPRILLLTDDVNANTSFHLDLAAADKIWQPDLFFYHLVWFEKMAAILPMDYLRVSGDKRMKYFTVVRIKFSCRMDFKSFPFDSQLCYCHIASTAHPMKHMVFSYETEDVLSNGTYDGLQSYDIRLEELPEGDEVDLVLGDSWSRGGFNLRLNRLYGLYVLRFIMPCCIMVVTSLISFIIPPDAVPGRIGLLATMFLVVTTLFGTVQVTSTYQIIFLKFIGNGKRIYRLMQPIY